MEHALGLAAVVRDRRDHAAFVDGDRVVTYGEFAARVLRAAQLLAADGVGAGDRVAIMLPNAVQFFEVWAAAGELGASVVLVNRHLKRDELDYILDDSQAKTLVDDIDAYEQELAGFSADAGTATLTIAALAPPVFYTSGTTGRPKGVVHGTFGGERAAIAQRGQVALWNWTPDDVYILSGPAYHAGPGGFVMAALFVGATSVILPTWDAREWLRLVDEHRVTLSFMTPAHFIRILEVPPDERARFDLSSLRVIAHGGAPCPVPVKRRIIDALGATEVWELYGASEGGATRISPSEWLTRPGSVGRPWPGIEIRILDDDGQILPVGATGLVYIVPAGGARFHYHDDAAKTDGAWHDGAFTVGDIGYVDEEGYLFLTDRASDMVISGGVNIYPREIEDVLYMHPAVVDCAVFGVPDARFGEALKAVVELRSAATTEELQAHVAAALADYKVPKQFEVVDELPRHPNGKVMKRWLREQAWAGEDRKIG